MVYNKKNFLLVYLISFAIWFLSLIIGFYIEDKFHISSDIIILNRNLTFSILFFNNIRMILSCLFGFLLAYIPTLFCLLLNGFVLGIFCKLSYNVNSSLLFIIKSILSHGAELIALYSASTISFFCFTNLLSKKKSKKVLDLLVYGTFICELEILLAAGVEYYFELT